MGILLKVTLILTLVLSSCAAAVVALAAGTTAYTTTAIGLPATAVAITTAGATWGTATYINSLESFRQEAPPTSTVARIFYEIRKLSQSVIYSAIVVFIVILLLFKKVRMRVKSIAQKYNPLSKK